MHPSFRPTVDRRIRRSFLLAPLLAALFVLPPAFGALPVSDGAVRVAHAQGGMDLGILSPSFSGLPLSVKSGQEFTITAVTADSARCAGWIIFRNLPPIELESQLASDGRCSWGVTVPPSARHGTANIGIEIARSGQSWALYGVTYVSPVGEQR